MKKVLFISSRGGHLDELLQLKDLFSKYDYSIVTEKTGATLLLKRIYGKRIFYLPYATRHNMWKYSFIFPFNCLKSVYFYFRIQPDVIVTTGTHTAVPMCYIAHLFKKKVIYIETFANIYTKTLTGKMVYPIADHFIVQWESMLKVYPGAKYRGRIF